MTTQLTLSAALFSLLTMAAGPAASQPAPAPQPAPVAPAIAPAPAVAPMAVVAPAIQAAPAVVPAPALPALARVVVPDLSGLDVPALLDPAAIAELDALPMRLAQAGFGQGIGQGRGAGRVFYAGSESSLYQAGLSMLDSEQWQRAVEMFDRVIGAGKTHVDGAMYWKAYALNRLGQRNDALSALQEMIKAYPSSRYLEDAKALEIEVRQNLGQPAKPEDHANDDLKLLAMSSLMRSDPDKAIPLLDQMLKGHDSPKVKQNALFVLGTSESPRAKEVLLQIARGNGNPDLQLKAIRYLATRKAPDTASKLAEIYASSKDPDVKREVIRYLSVAGGTDQLLNIAKTDPSPEMRVEAIRHLSATRGVDAGLLAQLYSTEKTTEIREQIVRQMVASGNAERAAELAKAEADAGVRAYAVRSLGAADTQKTGDALVQIYKADKDPNVKKAAISALHAQQNAKALVDIARGETDAAMKREIVSRLATMKSKEATDYMLEILK